LLLDESMTDSGQSAPGQSDQGGVSDGNSMARRPSS
jgi:hypothetical protein